MGKSIVTPIGRVSFPTLVEPKAYQTGSKPRYSMSLILPKNEPTTMEFVRNLQQVVKEVTAASGHPDYAQLFKALKDGDVPIPGKTLRAEYAGSYVITMNRSADAGKPRNNQPRVVGRDRMDIDPAEVYAGSYARAQAEVYVLKSGVPAGVFVSFNMVQKTGEGEPFGAPQPSPEEAFGELELPAEDPMAGVAPIGGIVPPVVQQPVPPVVQQPVQAPIAPNVDPFAAV